LSLVVFLTHFDSKYILTDGGSKKKEFTVRFGVKRMRKMSPEEKKGGRVK
jgi:hypothetical protein